jgi:hypothetical protein
MNRWLPTMCAVALASVACVSYSSSARNDNCEREVRQRILARNDGAENIQFERTGNDGRNRSGYGQWRRSNGERVQFEYQCRYGRNGGLSSASYDVVREGDGGWWSGGGRGDNRGGGWWGGDRGRRNDAEMQRECRAAVRREMEREYPRTSDVELQGERQGRGVFTGGNGKRRAFSWSCDWDASSGRVNDVDISLND